MSKSKTNKRSSTEADAIETLGTTDATFLEVVQKRLSAKSNVGQAPNDDAVWKPTGEADGSPTQYHLFIGNEIVKHTTLGVMVDGALTRNGTIPPLNDNMVIDESQLKKFWMATTNLKLDFSKLDVLPGEGHTSDQMPCFVATLNHYKSHKLPNNVANVTGPSLENNIRFNFALKLITVVRIVSLLTFLTIFHRLVLL